MSVEQELLIRKLRKKLRQIENLERTGRELCDEEQAKVDRKFEFREQLQIELNHLNEIDKSKIKEVEEEKEEVEERHTKVTENEDVNYSHKKTKAAPIESEPKLSENCENLKILKPKSLVEDSNIKKERKEREPNIKEAQVKSKKRKGWYLSQAVCSIEQLSGHNDLVLDLTMAGSTLLTASRDTTVKSWDIITGEEVHSFGGHTGPVTCLSVVRAEEAEVEGLDKDELVIISGSLDCSIKLWSLSKGHQLSSIYTFNPVTCIDISQTASAVVSCSDGGKLELWNLKNKTTRYSVLAHESRVTGVKVTDNLIYSSSCEGVIKVHQIDSKRGLSCVFVSENVKDVNGRPFRPRHVRSLTVCPRGVLFGEDSRNLKILDWRKGVVQKVTNHNLPFSSIDAMCCYGDWIFTSSYDIDHGLGYVNVRDSQTLDYITSLDDKDTERIIAIDSWRDDKGTLFVATGGAQLKLWTIFSNIGHKSREELLPTSFKTYLSKPAQDSESDSSGNEDSDEEDPSDKSGSSRETVEDLNNRWTSWCSVL